MNKLHARKVTINGETFASQKEYARWCELKLLEKAGEISGLQKQVKYVLIEGKYEAVPQYSEKTGKRIKDKCVCVERECAYIADFVYMDNRTRKLIVEDTKGYKKGATYEIFVLKRKLMLDKFGIRIKET